MSQQQKYYNDQSALLEKVNEHLKQLDVDEGEENK